MLLVLGRCGSDDLNNLDVDCSQSDLAVSLASKQNASSCKAADGNLSVSAQGGKTPYTFSLNGGAFQSSGNFMNLGAGSYTLVAKDAANCEKSVEVVVDANGATVDATVQTTPDTQCSSDNGTITVTAKDGTPPYSYQLDARGFGTTNSFTGLKNGQHTVVVKDANDCQKTISVQVPRGNTGISYKDVIQPILNTNCNLANCHSSGSSRGDWTVFANVRASANAIKSRTTGRSMPPSGSPALTQTQIDEIACWVDDGANNN